MIDDWLFHLFKGPAPALSFDVEGGGWGSNSRKCNSPTWNTLRITSRREPTFMSSETPALLVPKQRLCGVSGRLQSWSGTAFEMSIPPITNHTAFFVFKSESCFQIFAFKLESQSTITLLSCDLVSFYMVFTVIAVTQ